ncbi:hydroxymethylbilane synthase, partial [Vibrio parahaemolyticus]
LGLKARIRSFLDPEQSLPSPGQGTLAIEIPEGRDDIKRLLAPLHDVPAAVVSAAERSVSRIFGASCQIPLAAY